MRACTQTSPQYTDVLLALFVEEKYDKQGGICLAWGHSVKSTRGKTGMQDFWLKIHTPCSLCYRVQLNINSPFKA